MRKFNGMAHGLYGGDEALHGNNPTQGSELCSAVEMMFSLESVLEITGEVGYADKLEKIAFNALPAQITDDFERRQYFQQANQVKISRHIRNFDQNHGGTDVCYGILTGYPCCTANMHQGWPKFTQNLWYATADKGIAALVYSPSKVTTKVADGTTIGFTEETAYPFDETITFTYACKQPSVTFPFHLRIPEWCKKATILVNGKPFAHSGGKQVVKINRTWQPGDVVTLQLPMHVFNQSWYENARSVERGPITYALQIGEKVTKINNDKDPITYGPYYYEIEPTTAWNYGLLYVPDQLIRLCLQGGKDGC